MRELLATYERAGRRHLIELVDERDGGRLVIDRGPEGPERVVAELAPDEGTEHALCVLHGDGAYLERAQRGEPGLCRALTEADPPGQQPLAPAA